MLEARLSRITYDARPRRGWWLVCALALLRTAVLIRAAEATPGYWEVASTADLLSAVAAMPAVGGTIVLRPGTYALEAPLRFSRSNHVNLVGSGWNTTLQRRGAGAAIEFQDCSFCAVRDLMLAGDAAAASGNGVLYTGQSGSNSIAHCRLANWPESGVRYVGEATVPQSSNTVRDCHFIDNAGDQLASLHNNDFYLDGNQFGAHARQGARAPRSGVLLDHSAAGTYSRNYHWGNRVALRLVAGSHFNRIENNRFEQSRETGILIGDPEGREELYLTLFLGNTIHTNSEETSGACAAVEATRAVDFTFAANQVFSWNSAVTQHRSSLVLGTGCRNWIVKDNILRHNTGPALVFDPAAGHIVKDNLGQ